MKKESTRAQTYRDVVKLLASGPMTIAEIAERTGHTRSRVSQACLVLRTVGEAHIGSFVTSPGGASVRRYHAGPGIDVAARTRGNRQVNPPLSGKVLAALTNPMTVQQVMEKVFYTRPAVAHVLQLLCVSGDVRIHDRITQRGGTTLVYARTGAL